MSDRIDCANSEHCGNVRRSASRLCGPCSDDAADEGRMSRMYLDESNGSFEVDDAVRRTEHDAVVRCLGMEDADGYVERFDREAGIAWIEWRRGKVVESPKDYVVTASNSKLTRHTAEFDTLPEAQAEMTRVLQSNLPRWSKVTLAYCGGRVTSIERSEDPEQFTDH
jgi:hypothetical protein